MSFYGKNKIHSKKLRFDIEISKKKPETLVSFITVLTKLFHYDFKQILFVLLNPTRNYALQF